MNKFEMERFESELSRQLRNHPWMTLLGNIIIFRLLVLFGGPVLLYTMNALFRAQYKATFVGREGTERAIRTWNELVSELDAIADMGVIGKMLVEMPAIFRVITVFVTLVLLALMFYFMANMWESLLDHHQEVKQGAIIIFMAVKTIIIALWNCMNMFFRGVFIILKCVVMVLGVASLRTYYGIRKMYRKGRRAYRRYKVRNSNLKKM